LPPPPHAPRPSTTSTSAANRRARVLTLRRTSQPRRPSLSAAAG
jgi:hypothetical protein